MKDEIKEILEDNGELIVRYKDNSFECFDTLPKNVLDYITNLHQEVKEANDSVTWWNNRYNAVVKNCNETVKKMIALGEENERLKKALNCKEYFSSIMPENTEFVILTKNNYDRQQKDIQLELIDCKSRIEKASDKIQYIIDYGFDYDGFNTVESLKGLIDMLVDYARESKNILQNGSDSQ